MKIKIKRFDKELPLPEYKTAGAAGFDSGDAVGNLPASGESNPQDAELRERIRRETEY